MVANQVGEHRFKDGGTVGFGELLFGRSGDYVNHIVELPPRVRVRLQPEAFGQGGSNLIGSDAVEHLFLVGSPRLGLGWLGLWFLLRLFAWSAGDALPANVPIPACPGHDSEGEPLD